MKLLSRRDLTTLIGNVMGPCVSFYVPAAASEEAFRHDLQELLCEARQLMTKGYQADFVDQFLSEVAKAATKLPAPDPLHSTAVFFSRHRQGYFRQNDSWSRLAVVANSFHVKPLLPWLQTHEDYFLLYTSQEEMRVFAGQAEGPQVIWEDCSPDLGLASRRPHQLRPSKLPFSFEEKRNLVRYFRMLDIRLKSAWHERETPLILAGDASFHDFFLMVSKYRYVAREIISAELREPSALHRKAITISQHLKTVETRQMTELFRKLRPKGMATDELHTIVNAIGRGRVRTLMIEKGAQLWGNFNPKTGKIQSHKGQIDAHDDDIYDDLAELVIKKGGKVFLMDNMVPMPTHAPIAAILR